MAPTIESLLAAREETLSAISRLESEVEELEAAIEAAKVSVIALPAVEIELRSGEWYAGAVLNEDGSIKHHLIVAASCNKGRTFEQVQAWAEELGYSAPTRQESRLIVAHHHGRLDSMRALWTCEKHENAACAWLCLLYNGTVYYGNRSSELGGVAVRKVKFKTVKPSSF